MTRIRAEDIHDAVETLRAAGIAVNLLCHPSTDLFDPTVPQCAEGTFTSRHLVQDDLLEDVDRAFVIHNVIGAVITICCVAVAAGLFLGLMTLDVLDLQILVRSSVDEAEVRYAETLLPIIKDKHRLLVTLLVMDTLAYEALPIFLDALMSGWVAVLLSTALIVVFGEIIPSGFFTGPNQLYLGCKLAPLVKLFMTLLYPIAMPLGLLLDWLVDEDENGQYYDRMELSALVNIQHEARTNKQRPRLTKVIKYVRNKDRNWLDLKAEIMEKVKERADAIDVVSEEEAAVDQLTPPLHQREVDMVLGSLSMKTKLAMDVYTPLKHVYAVSDDLLLDQDTITTIYSHGYSRVPVYRRNLHDEDDIGAITGYLITRQLMLIDWAHNRPLSTLPSQRPTCVSPRLNLVDLLRLLQTKGPLLTFVCARPDLANRALKQHKPIPVEAGLIGIITLVDIVESILQDRIYDESDIHNRNNAVATLHRWAALKLQSFVRRRRSMLRTGSSRRGNSLSHSTSPSRKVELRPDEGVTEQTPLLSPTDRSLPTDGSMV